MSKAETIVEQSRKLLGLMDGYVMGMPRQRKFTIGDRIMFRAIGILEDMVQAYYGKVAVKSPLMEKANIDLEILRQLLRYLLETGNHDLRKHERFIKEIDKTGAMLGGWRVYLDKSASDSR